MRAGSVDAAVPAATNGPSANGAAGGMAAAAAAAGRQQAAGAGAAPKAKSPAANGKAPAKPIPNPPPANNAAQPSAVPDPATRLTEVTSAISPISAKRTKQGSPQDNCLQLGLFLATSPPPANGAAQPSAVPDSAAQLTEVSNLCKRNTTRFASRNSALHSFGRQSSPPTNGAAQPSAVPDLAMRLPEVGIVM